MKRLTNVVFTAQGAGYFRVIRDGIQVSQHTAIHKAQERAINEQIAHPDSVIHFEQTLTVTLTPKFEVVEQPGGRSGTHSFTTE